MGADAAPVLPARRGVIKKPDPEIPEAVLLALERIDAVTRAKAAKARQAVLALAPGLKAKEPEDRVKALRKIADFGLDANVVGEQVIEAMRDKVSAVQLAAAETLAKINPKVHTHVVSILRGSNKREAIQALGELGSEAAITVPLLLYCNDNTRFWWSNPKVGTFYEDLFPVLAKIAPKDKRFSDAVLGCVSAPNPNRYNTLRERRVAGIAQLDVINAETGEKVKALVAALDDDQATLEVIKALQGYGQNAAPALPALKKLKMSPHEAIRNAAINTIAKIEP